MKTGAADRRLHDGNLRLPASAEVLRKLSYDRETGVFRWAVSPAQSIKAGTIAGHVHKKKTKGYREIKIAGVICFAHRLAWLFVHGDWPGSELDHINGDRSDNRICNLRPATRSQNLANVRRHCDNTSGFKGVSASGRKWRATIKIGRLQRHLGVFENKEAAAAAYRAAAEANFGAFARAA